MAPLQNENPKMAAVNLSTHNTTPPTSPTATNFNANNDKQQQQNQATNIYTKTQLNTTSVTTKVPPPKLTKIPQPTNHSNTSISSISTNETKSNTKKSNDFLERVKQAMNSSKPPKAPITTKLKINSINTIDTTTSTTSTTTAINGNRHDLPARPPLPPQIPKSATRRLLKASTNNPTTNGSPTTSFDSEDGLLISQQLTSKNLATPRTLSNQNIFGLKSPKANAQPATATVLNGYKTASSSIISNGLGNHDIQNGFTPIEVSLKLPISKTATSNGISSLPTAKKLRSPSPSYSTRSESSSRCSSSQSRTMSSLSSSNTNTNSISNHTNLPRFERLQTPPRRIFPQTYTRGDPLDIQEMRNLESSPVVFDGNLSFVLGCKKQPVHQSLHALPSHQDSRTTSAYLSEKIQNFLRRTDHVQEEWSALSKRSRRATSTTSWHGGNTGGGGNSFDSGRSTPTNSMFSPDFDTISLIERQRERNSMERCSSLGRSRSSQNILTKAFQMSKNLTFSSASRSNSMARESSVATVTDDEDLTIREEDDYVDDDDDKDMEELSELTVDLAEERSTATMATERLEAETAERLKLEKDLSDQQQKVKGLQETTEKLEMELICAKSGLNGMTEEEDLENEDGCGGAGDNSVYKLKYERVARELEFTKRRLQTQHEHDLEQLIGLKKQLEKKLSDAYEEVEEQRQVVGQWKRKAQKMTNEMNDLRMLLEEQNSRNNLLEKKQRKFDTESQTLLDTVRSERQAKERLSREKDVLMAEKFQLEQSLADTRLELELKEDKLNSVQRELEELTFSGNTEEEMAQLRRTKNELERRLKEQEEELDEMAGQIQMLEQAKLRLEMTLETMRKEARREAQQRDEELEEARGTAFKRIKALECQLETEHEERSLLVREKHELERRLASMEDIDRDNRQKEEAANQKIRRDLRKYKALLKDAHAQLERLKVETPGKTLIRQLRNQLEDAESARSSAVKARQTTEAELTELQAMFEESQRGRNDAEDRANAAHRDRAELQAQIEENEEELAELMKKYSAIVKQLNTEKVAVSEYEFKLSELEAERNNLKVQVGELQQRLENMESLADPSTTMLSKRLELRTKELESRLDLEQATRGRLETQITRHKEALEKLQNELSQAKMRELQAQEASKKSQKSLREMREEFHAVSSREQDSAMKRKELEKKLENSEAEAAALRNDLRLALQRIADLQQAMEEGDDDDLSEEDDSETSDGSISDDQLRSLRLERSNLRLDNGTPQSTKTLVRDKEDGSPRITLTSPTSSNVPKLVASSSKSAKTAGKLSLTPPTPSHK